MIQSQAIHITICSSKRKPYYVSNPLDLEKLKQLNWKHTPNNGYHTICSSKRKQYYVSNPLDLEKLRQLNWKHTPNNGYHAICSSKRKQYYVSNPLDLEKLRQLNSKHTPNNGYHWRAFMHRYPPYMLRFTDPREAVLLLAVVIAVWVSSPNKIGK